MQVATIVADHEQIDKRTTTRNQNKRRLGTASKSITGLEEGGGVQLVCDRPTLALSSALVPQTLSCSVCVEDS